MTYYQVCFYHISKKLFLQQFNCNSTIKISTVLFEIFCIYNLCRKKFSQFDCRYVGINTFEYFRNTLFCIFNSRLFSVADSNVRFPRMPVGIIAIEYSVQFIQFLILCGLDVQHFIVEMIEFFQLDRKSSIIRANIFYFFYQKTSIFQRKTAKRNMVRNAIAYLIADIGKILQKIIDLFLSRFVKYGVDCQKFIFFA